MQLNSQNNQPIEFTQGDVIVLELIATDDSGNPVDLTGATLTTQILGPNTAGVVTFPNSQHTIASDQVANRGKFSLALASGDTANCGDGAGKQIITEAIITSDSVYYRSPNFLTVNVNVPVQ